MGYLPPCATFCGYIVTALPARRHATVLLQAPAACHSVIMTPDAELGLLVPGPGTGCISAGQKHSPEYKRLTPTGVSGCYHNYWHGYGWRQAQGCWGAYCHAMSGRLLVNAAWALDLLVVDISPHWL